MAVFNPRNDLIENFAGFILVHSLFFHNVIEKLSFTEELHDQEKVLWWFYNLIKLDDVGVSDKLQNVYLSGDSFDICYVDDFIFLQNLDGDLFACGYVCGQLDLSKCAFSKGLFFKLHKKLLMM